MNHLMADPGKSRTAAPTWLERLWIVVSIQATVIVAGALAGWVFGMEAGAGSVMLAVIASLNAAAFCALTADALLSRLMQRRRQPQRM